MRHIALVGDSIFDNAAYVAAGDSVSEHLQSLLADGELVNLLAVDGDVTSDVPSRLAGLTVDSSHVFLSVGGNDALQAVSVLSETVASVKHALRVLSGIRNKFRQDYASVLDVLMSRNKQLTICTIYNMIPAVGEEALTALALFNEVILQEAMARSLPIIDLRNSCNELQDFSEQFPIEPSKYGAAKIAQLIHHIVRNHDFVGHGIKVYV